MSELTVISPIKAPPSFRDGEWLSEYLSSLSEQTYPVKVIVIDYGSVDEFKQQFRQQCQQWQANSLDVEYIEVASHINYTNSNTASNVGIRMTKTPYILLTDIDCLFDKNFCSIVFEELKKATRFNLKRIINSRAYELLADGRRGDVASDSDIGSCIGLPTAWLQSVRGFDEAYQGWGLEDLDLLERARRDEFKQLWIQGHTWHYQRHHPRPPAPNIKANQNYFNAHLGTPIIRNDETWGKYQ